jgi:hypothetical protein
VAVRLGLLKDSTLRVRPVGSPGVSPSPAPPTWPSTARYAYRAISSATPCFFRNGEEERFFRNGEEERVAIKLSFITNDADDAITLAERGGGVAIVFACQVVEQVKAGAL